MAAGGACALVLALVGVALLFRSPTQVAVATPTPTKTPAPAEQGEDQRWSDLAREEIRRAREESRRGDPAGARLRLQRCMALLKEEAGSKSARLLVFEALEALPPPQADPAQTPTPSPSFVDQPVEPQPEGPGAEPEEEPEENPFLAKDDPLEPEEVEEPGQPEERPFPRPTRAPVEDPLSVDPSGEPAEAGGEAGEFMRGAEGRVRAARLWLLAAAAFDRPERLALQKVVELILKETKTGVYAIAGQGLLAFLHDDFGKARRILEPLQTDPKLRKEVQEAGMSRPQDVLVRVAFYTKHYELARKVAEGLEDPSERRVWKLLVDGPFASEFPNIYPALTTMSPDKSYRVISDVGVTGAELDRLEQEAAGGSPAQRDALQRKVRKSHKLLATIAEVLDKASLAYGKLLPVKTRKEVYPTVYVFRDRAGFSRFGRGIGIGSTENALGYYMPDYRVLVFYEETEDVKLGLSRNTVETLLHETFHQWIHLHLEEAPPWFNEGMAEYFSLGAKIGRKSLEYAVVPQGNPSRLSNIRDAIRGEFARPWSLRDLMRADQRGFMTPGQSGVNYAHAWSLVHYLGATSKRRRLLRSYFKALLTGVGSHAAYTKVFGRLDMNAMQAEWKDYILTLK